MEAGRRRPGYITSIMSTFTPDAPRAAVDLERALLLTFVAHVVAMVGMVVFLLPGVPGGSAGGVSERAAYVAAHPWLWRAGWLGWQLTAASDLYLSIALLRTVWIPKRPAWFALTLTLAALVPDQVGQLIWSLHGPHDAAAALADGALPRYAVTEARLFLAVGGWGAGLYLIAAVGWTVCLRQAGVWSKTLRRLSVGTWSLFAVAATMLFIPQSSWTSLVSSIAGGLNAVAFVFLVAWIATASELVMRRARPASQYGNQTRWSYPQAGLHSRLINYLATSRFVRGLFEYAPALSMKSDIRDVIYVNYLVDADALAAHVPPPLELQRLGDAGRYAMFSFLIYRHGHFGPTIFGPLRRLWRSPIQSDWRAYVRDPISGLEGVYFLTTAITATPYALAARLLSEGVAMHVPRDADMKSLAGGGWEATLDPGTGSAPDVRLSLRPAENDQSLSTAWQTIFGTWEAVLAYCVPQNRALAVQPWYGRIVVQGIRLEIPFASCQRLEGDVRSKAAEAYAGDASALCFYLPKGSFFYDGERES